MWCSNGLSQSLRYCYQRLLYSLTELTNGPPSDVSCSAPGVRRGRLGHKDAGRESSSTLNLNPGPDSCPDPKRVPPYP